MSVAGLAHNFHARTLESVIGSVLERAFGFWLKKAWPSAAGLKLCIGFKQFGAAADTGISAALSFVPEFIVERSFCGALARHAKLHIGQSRFPKRLWLVFPVHKRYNIATRG